MGPLQKKCPEFGVEMTVTLDDKSYKEYLVQKKILERIMKNENLELVYSRTKFTEMLVEAKNDPAKKNNISKMHVTEMSIPENEFADLYIGFIFKKKDAIKTNSRN